MIRLSLVSVFVMASLTAQMNTVGTPNTLSRLCGRVVRDLSRDRSFGQLKGISGAIVQLYGAQGNSACCDAALPVAGRKTRRSGEFEFKKEPPGTYWLLVPFEGRKYAMKVSYKSDRKGDSGSCSDSLFTIRQSGDFILETRILLG